MKQVFAKGSKQYGARKFLMAFAHMSERGTSGSAKPLNLPMAAKQNKTKTKQKKKKGLTKHGISKLKYIIALCEYLAVQFLLSDDSVAKCWFEMGC